MDRDEVDTHLYKGQGERKKEADIQQSWPEQAWSNKGLSCHMANENNREFIILERGR